MEQGDPWIARMSERFDRWESVLSSGFDRIEASLVKLAAVTIEFPSSHNSSFMDPPPHQIILAPEIPPYRSQLSSSFLDASLTIHSSYTLYSYHQFFHC